MLRAVIVITGASHATSDKPKILTTLCCAAPAIEVRKTVNSNAVINPASANRSLRACKKKLSFSSEQIMFYVQFYCMFVQFGVRVFGVR